MVRFLTAVASVLLCIVPGAAKAFGQATPKIVLQSIQETGFDVATWSADSRFVFTASGAQSELLVWDIGRRLIVDRAGLPLPEGASQAVFYGMRLSADGRSLELSGETLDADAPQGRRMHGWRIDIATRRAELIGTQPAPPLSSGDAADRWKRRQMAQRNAHLSAVLMGVPGWTPPTLLEEAMLPPLPPSPDGRWQMLRAYPAFTLQAKSGATASMLSQRLVNRIYAAAMSEDGRLAMLTDDIGYFDAKEMESIVRGGGAPGRAKDQRLVLEIFDLRSSRFTLRSRLRGDHQSVGWAADGSIRLYSRPARGKAQVREVEPSTGAVGRPRAIDDPAAVVSAGTLPGRSIGWSVSPDGLLRLWDIVSGETLLEVTFFNGQRFIAVGKDGRYDTDLGADAKELRWLLPDAPFQSLAAQTFMRDLYEPRLIAKRLDCVAAGDCPTRLPAVTPITDLDRLLPTVRIGKISPIEGRPGWVHVTVLAEDGVDPKTGRRSGVFGVRLSVADREVARAPDHAADPVRTDLADWRDANRSRPDADGQYRFEFEVPVSTDPQIKPFKAYAFNGDRVKSDTAEEAWTPPLWPQRPRRAFIVSIGIDAYDEPRLKLRFAVSDSVLISDRLSRRPLDRCPPFSGCISSAYQARRSTLTTGVGADGSLRRVTRADVLGALSLLAPGRGGGAVDLLRQAGHDVAALDEATPDDVVIISFSGHGYADAAGRFALLPGDARWPAGSPSPDPSRIITADDLAAALRRIQAGEIALIIDACHAGASVDTPGFKPGPMGDRGLGQLAFDKGIRILAATQADDVALESDRLRQGLLSFALAAEGITEEGGKADLDSDGRITLDEWLGYALRRMPTLALETRRGGMGTVGYSGGFTFFDRPATAAPTVQQPSLFDFDGGASPIVLRDLRPKDRRR